MPQSKSIDSLPRSFYALPDSPIPVPSATLAGGRGADSFMPAFPSAVNPADLPEFEAWPDRTLISRARSDAACSRSLPRPGRRRRGDIAIPSASAFGASLYRHRDGPLLAERGGTIQAGAGLVEKCARHGRLNALPRRRGGCLVPNHPMVKGVYAPILLRNDHSRHSPSGRMTHISAPGCDL